MSLVEEILKETKSFNKEEEFLTSFLTEKPIGSLLKIYSQIEVLIQRQLPNPASINAKGDATEAYDYLRCHYFLSDAEELVRLLAKPHFKSLLQCHDSVANKQYEPFLPPVPHEVDEDDVAVKVVHLVKQNEPLGATIKINQRNGAVLVARIMHGGAADRSKSFSVGDEIQEINQFNVMRKDPMEVINVLTSISGDVRLKLIPSNQKKLGSDQNQGHVRAQFSYSPAMDNLIPCREAGLAFRRCDILRLVNTEDPHWWQAVKLDASGVSTGGAMITSTTPLTASSGGGKAGLIPSRALQQMKELYRDSGGVNPKVKDPSICNQPSKEFLIYEEVEKYFAEEGNYRAIVLTGPSGVGKNELKQNLINTDLNHFKEPIRITTREPQAGEKHGQDFFFVTKEEFDTFQQADSLVDQNEYNGEQYGLCLDASLDVIQNGQVAVFTMQPQYLNSVRVASIKPFIVYMKPPSLDVLMETRGVLEREMEECELTEADIGSGMENMERRLANRNNSEFSESDLKEMLKSAERIELTYGHLFDYVIVNDDRPVALEKLSDLAYRLETEPFWVPKRWLNEDSSAASSTI